MKLLLRVASLILLAELGLHAGSALAQSYPSRPIRVVLPFTPGAALDTTMRLVGGKMADALNQPVVIENRPGADGIIGADLVAKAAPNGYTILLTTPILAISPAIHRKLPFDAVKDFAPVTELVVSSLILLVGPKVPAASVTELIALAKSKPGGLNYGHPSVGNQYLAMELLKLSAGIDILPIPYKGNGPINNALMSGEVDVAFMTISSSVQSPIKAGRLRALGVTSARRSPVFPDVPTVAEAGVAGFEVNSWQGLFVPAQTPQHIIELIHREAVKALNNPDVRARLEGLGNEIVGSTPEEFDAKFKADLAKYAMIVKEARIPPQD